MKKKSTRKRISKTKHNPSRTKGYDVKAVDAAIASSNRAGRHIGKKERTLIHRLLMGRAPKQISVKRNPRPEYIIRGKFFNREEPFYWDGVRWWREKSKAQRFPSLQNAKNLMRSRQGNWSSVFPSLNTTGVIKA